MRPMKPRSLGLCALLVGVQISAFATSGQQPFNIQIRPTETSVLFDEPFLSDVSDPSVHAGIQVELRRDAAVSGPHDRDLGLFIIVTNLSEPSAKRFSGVPDPDAGYFEVRDIGTSEIVQCKMWGKVEGDPGQPMPFPMGTADILHVSYRAIDCHPVPKPVSVFDFRTCILPGYYALKGSPVCSDWLRVGERIAQESETENKKPIRTAKSLTELSRLYFWADDSTKLVVSSSEDAAVTVENTVEKIAFYQSERGFALLGLLLEPHSKSVFLVRGGQSFYISRNGEMIGCMVGAGIITLTKNMGVVPGVAKIDDSVVTKLVNALGEQKLLSAYREGRIIDLKSGVPFQFWTRNSSESSQPGQLGIDGISLEGDVLKLDLASELDKYHGSFWIDLKTGTLIKKHLVTNPF